MLTLNLFFYLCLLCLSGGTAMAATPSSGSTTRDLDQTPTWAVAAVCTVFIMISIVLEKFIHKLGTVFTEKHKKALFDALDKVKSELMILGFISLLLTFGQSYIVKICVPEKVGVSMMPCPLKVEKGSTTTTEGEHRRRLLWYHRRFLSSGSETISCEDGKVALLSSNGLHQLHILIFFLAVFHVLYSAITMMLGRLKIRGWKEWEKETSSHDYEFSNDPARFRLTHETSFVRSHASFWTKIPFYFYIGCFFRQFYRSVRKSDYLTLRNGFISAHLAPGSNFNFQKYIKRSLEDDFKVVVGVSPICWASFVIFLLVNVDGGHAMFWAFLIPVIIILAVGTKLQSILTKMALEITERHAVVQGIPLVQGSDKYFWFDWPHLLLHLIHFALFQNAFQITYFLWIWYSFGTDNCFHADFVLAAVKVAVGLGVLSICSYITLPLYALVTQMGSGMKKSIFDEHTMKALKNWRRMAVRRKGGRGGKSPTPTLASPKVSTLKSSERSLHRFKTTGHSGRTTALNEDPETSDYDTDQLSPTSRSELIIKVDHDEDQNEIKEPHREEETRNEGEFSFVKPGPGKGP